MPDKNENALALNCLTSVGILDLHSIPDLYMKQRISFSVIVL